MKREGAVVARLVLLAQMAPGGSIGPGRAAPEDRSLARAVGNTPLVGRIEWLVPWCLAAHDDLDVSACFVRSSAGV